ncbi:MAG: hypothetical protein IT537_09295 [Hyphomicrobiales bacterium]|nr:hypothetical protein [Hyphomicrobiales bacterium]
MSARLAVILALLLVSAGTAMAADTAAAESESSAVRLPRPAPVGHRQPRPADIAAAKPGKDRYDVAVERLNRAADSTLRICRGC